MFWNNYLLKMSHIKILKFVEYDEKKNGIDILNTFKSYLFFSPLQGSCFRGFNLLKKGLGEFKTFEHKLDQYEFYFKKGRSQFFLTEFSIF